MISGGNGGNASAEGISEKDLATLRDLAMDYDDKLVAAAKDRKSVRKQIEVFNAGVSIVATLSEKVLPLIGGYINAGMPAHGTVVKDLHAKVSELQQLVGRLNAAKEELPAG